MLSPLRPVGRLANPGGSQYPLMTRDLHPHWTTDHSSTESTSVNWEYTLQTTNQAVRVSVRYHPSRHEAVNQWCFIVGPPLVQSLVSAGVVLNRHHTFIQCCFNVGPMSSTLGHQCPRCWSSIKPALCNQHILYIREVPHRQARHVYQMVV